jgi:hypothetical protein
VMAYGMRRPNPTTNASSYTQSWSNSLYFSINLTLLQFQRGYVLLGAFQ